MRAASIIRRWRGMGGTIVILMGVKQLPAITRRLIENGLAADTPAAVIEWGTLPRQRMYVASAASIADIAREQEISPPAITVIGDVVRLREAGMAWYDLLPENVISTQLEAALAW